MKVIVCLVAFIMGCFITVNIRKPEASENTNNALGEVVLGAIAPAAKKNYEMKIEKSSFGVTSAGDKITKFRCTNANGYVMEMIDYGATVTSFEMFDRTGESSNITLSCPDIAGYQACGSYFGCTVGRYCNRIANGRFTLDGNEYTLATNNDPHHLHGGAVGFDKRIWGVTEIQSESSVGLRFTLTSKDGDEGYPGNLTVIAEYILNNKNEMVVDLKATTDKATHVNLTNHCYWNLAGQGSGNILGHKLMVAAEKYLPVDATGIPTSELANVADTPFDFVEWHTIGERINQIKSEPVGYDHCYVLRSQSGEMAVCARIKDPESGRMMEIHTTQPGLQFYSGNFLDGQAGSGGFKQYDAFCLETQKYPDTPNQSGFPSTMLKPGETYHQTTIHKFSIAQ